VTTPETVAPDVSESMYTTGGGSPLTVTVKEYDAELGIISVSVATAVMVWEPALNDTTFSR